METSVLDVLVIGAGPGGYVAAIRAAQLGMQVGCVEKEPQLGGTCLRVGCIPSKALLESSARYYEAKTHFAAHGVVFEGVHADVGVMQKRKAQIVRTLTQGVAGLFKKNKIKHFVGTASFVGRTAQGDVRVQVVGAEGTQEVVAKRVLVATGSKEAQLKGVAVDGVYVGGSTEALEYAEPPKELVVIGAGAIGLEMGSVWSRLGSKVTVLEYADRILPGMDVELGTHAKRVLEKQGLTFRLGARVTGVQVQDNACVVHIEGSEPLACSKVLVAVGRVPNTDGLGLDRIGVVPDARGRIPVDAHFATSAAGVYAIGDVIAGPMLAHKAEEEGVACVEMMATGYGHVNYDAVSFVVYTEPEIAAVGKTEEQLKEAGVPYKKGVFPFMANARAKAIGDTNGFVKILAHAETDRVLGVHILGPRASDLIAEAVVAVSFGASSEDIARTCHPHPTLCEVVKEAALAVDGRPIHI
jgi:dihydrolipoamide dehydrogenase